MKGGKVGCGLGRKAGTAPWPGGCLLLLLSGAVSPFSFSLSVALFSVFFSSFFMAYGVLDGIHLRRWEDPSYVPKRLELALLLYNTRAILHIYFVEMIRVRMLRLCVLGDE